MSSKPNALSDLAFFVVLARQPSLEGSVRSGILFQLAAAWEKRKDHDKAFLLATQANAAAPN